MSNNERVYLNLLQDIMANGVASDDRTGVGTIRVFGRLMRFDLKEGFPLLTTKKMGFRSVLSELLWFLEGSNNERRLAEILYGENHPDLDSKTTIWTENAEASYWRPKAEFRGDLGEVYGWLWRQWPDHHNGGKVDQIEQLIEGIKKDPNGRRHILNAWNAASLGYGALPPCHVMAQFSVINGALSCLMTQRSADALLGEPYNIASYALLTHMVAQVCDLEVGELVISVGDCHIYKNHIEQVQEQLTREPYPLATLQIDPSIKDIDDFRMHHFKLVGYKSHPAITAPMAV